MQTHFEIFRRFLVLGCTSFGGPAAHLGYFRAEFVERLGWLDEAAYARLVALGQFLPGPGSSQVGFAIGLERAGLAGGLAAFLGFTLPSFLLMLALGTGAASVAGAAWFDAVVAGLKLLAVVVVADATLGMWRAFCLSRLGAALAVGSASAMLVLPDPAMQLVVLAVAALTGALWMMPPEPGRGLSQSDTADGAAGPVQWLPLVLFAGLLLGLPWLAALDARLDLFANFYESGALVFGGGHVVLPLLQQMLGPALTPDVFLTGYAAAQAVPGPMFTLATFLGTRLADNPALGAGLATLAIFLPGFLLVLGLRGAWHGLAAQPRVAAAAAGLNAAVVGLLLAALYQPVFLSAVRDGTDLAVALVGALVLMRLRPPIVVLVLAFALMGLARHG